MTQNPETGPKNSPDDEDSTPSKSAYVKPTRPQQPAEAGVPAGYAERLEGIDRNNNNENVLPPPRMDEQIRGGLWNILKDLYNEIREGRIDRDTLNRVDKILLRLGRELSRILIAI